MKMRIVSAVLIAALAAAPLAAHADGKMTVAYAGSMGVVMDHGLGPSFTKQTGVAYQGIGQGALALAHLLAAGTMSLTLAHQPWVGQALAVTTTIS
ncbi:MAG: hypothetical protein B7X01_03470, partial [Acidiphilium sp. 21-62-4]